MEKTYLSAEIEALIQKKWAAEKTYTSPRSKESVYSIDTPPPTVSGALHIGHLFSYTQTDIIARYQRMQGKNVFYPFGFDDNGLPTERFIEKKRGVSAFKMSRSAFINICLQETEAIEKQFIALWQGMGLSVDWKACYSTISAQTRQISQASFLDLYKKGFIYRRNEPALYCTTCKTSVAQAELDDAERPSTFNDIQFSTTDGKKITIATTRPELLASCVAIFYHPDDARYKTLAGTKAIVPIFGQQVCCMPDESVLIDKGTGLAMCCTFGDKTDIAWFKKYSLPYQPSIGNDGKFLPLTGPLTGLSARDARKKILEILAQQEILLQQKPLTHTVSIHERCKQDIEYLMLPQWFLRILPYKKQLIELADSISWHPEHMKARYQNWVENLGWDWCLSRQRFFGIPFPVWHCTDCSEVITAASTQLPLDPRETAFNKPCPACASTNIVADTDVMDTWNTSSLTPYLCAALQGEDAKTLFERESIPFLPMAMRPQAHDIIRTWAFYTILKTWMHHKVAPWSSIVISGHVLSGEKEKISKSQDNSPLAPDNLLSRYPADAIRYWTASASLGTDVAFSENQLKIGQRLLTKLWNAFRFIKEHVPQKPSLEKSTSLSPVNSWLYHSLWNTYTTYKKNFEIHEFSHALLAVEQFFWHDFCDNYIELVKDQLFNPTNYRSEERRETLYTLYDIGLSILQLYAPFVPHVTESIYEILYAGEMKNASLHQTHIEDFLKPYRDESAAHTVHILTNVVRAVRKIKSDNQLSLKAELTALTIAGSPEEILTLRPLESLIRGISHAKAIVYEQRSNQIASFNIHDDGANDAYIVIGE